MENEGDFLESTQMKKKALTLSLARVNGTIQMELTLPGALTKTRKDLEEKSALIQYYCTIEYRCTPKISLLK